MAWTTQQVRIMLGDRIPLGSTDEDTFFTDEEIDDLLDNSANAYEAVSLGWSMKAAEYAELIDTEEAGSTRKMSQLFRQATQMADYWSKLASAEVVAVNSGKRVVGRSIDILVEEEVLPMISQFSSGEEIRQYPLKRMHAVVSGVVQ